MMMSSVEFSMTQNPSNLVVIFSGLCRNVTFT